LAGAISPGYPAAGWVTTGSTRTAEIAARRVVRFKIGKVFKDAVDRPAADG